MRCSRPLVLVLGVILATTTTGSAVLAADDDFPLSSVETEFLDLVNAERAAVGAEELRPLDPLTAGAREQSGRMRDAGYIFHTVDLIPVLPDGWKKLGENVGVGYEAEPLHEAFMGSDGHRANVLDPEFDRIGVGVVLDEGTIWVTFIFADSIPGFDFDSLLTETVDGRFDDDDGSIFEEAIETLAAAGITSGCAPDRFCPDDHVTRGQMAAFLVRALDLDAATGDHFDDDDGSTFEPAIEALAAAGITSGCAEGRFCPEQPVTRGAMASFLGRALDLDPSDADEFADDDGSVHEGAIQALAAAGITRGCAEGRFCPNEPVTRGQMAQFLVRALGL